MATYILCMNYRGPRADFHQSLDERTSEPQKVLEAAGGKLVGFYRTQGRFDVIVIVEMPNAETVQAFNLAMQDEHFTVETMRAFTPQEYPAIWKRAGKLLKDAGIAG